MMADRHEKVGRELYILIPSTIVLIGVGILFVVSNMERGVDFLFVLVIAFLLVAIGLITRRIRHLLLDLRAPPKEIEGLLVDKKCIQPRDRRQSPHYYFCIDNLGFGLECDKDDWDLVDTGVRIRVLYHQHSKRLESMKILDY